MSQSLTWAQADYASAPWRQFALHLQNKTIMLALNRRLVLIVDDTPPNVAVVSGVLKDRTKVATNGEKALAEKPDLILLVVMMPGMDGYEVCRRLKDIPATCDIPIIFLTAKTDEVDEEKGFDVGGVDYIHKPFSTPIVSESGRNSRCRKRSPRPRRRARWKINDWRRLHGSCRSAPQGQ
jgi:CheY-like chemotaxis protein